MSLRKAPTSLKKIIGSYKVPILPLSEDTLVIDCGVGQGYFFWFYNSFFSKYIGIEASTDNINSLKKKIALSKSQNSKIFHYACYSEDDKELELKTIKGNSVLAKGFSANNRSLYFEVGQKNKNWDNAITKDDLEIELVKTITIEGIFKKFKIDKIDLLKVDIDGAEFDFLMNKDLSKIRYLSIEAPLKPNLNLTKKNKTLLRYIEDQGFVKIFGNGKDFSFANKNEDISKIYFVDFPTLYFSKLKNNFPFSDDEDESYKKLNDEKKVSRFSFLNKFYKKFK